jgi:uncharacterized protein YndB with AHSA1/START domain
MTTPTPTAPLDLRTSRHLSASPEDVFDAYTDAEKQKIWFTILDDEPGIVEIEVDLRIGGQQVAAWGPSEDALFREIDRPHRLVTESVGSTPDGQTMTTHVTVTFEADGDGTLMTVHQTGFPVPEIRDFFATEVWNGALDRIEAYLRRVAGERSR